MHVYVETRWDYVPTGYWRPFGQFLMILKTSLGNALRVQQTLSVSSVLTENTFSGSPNKSGDPLGKSSNVYLGVLHWLQYMKMKNTRENVTSQ
jgi:hypothetical protein